METPHYSAMAPSSEGVNPLRPYYKPPSIGVQPNATAGNASGISSAKEAASGFGASARDLLSEMNYGNYSEFMGDAGPSTLEQVKTLMDAAVWKYTSVFTAQPFDVAKTVLQCHLARGSLSDGGAGAMGVAAEQYYAFDQEEDDEDDDDEPAYFTSNNTSASGRLAPRPATLDRRRTGSPSSSNTKPKPSHSAPLYKLELRQADSITEVLSQLWQREGAWGVWKGTNSTFVYSILLKTVEVWTRGLLCALLNIPDAGPLASASGGAVGGLDIIDSPSPMGSLVVAVAAAGLAGVLLSPLDTVRTKLIITPVTSSTRSLLSNLRSLPSFICPPQLLMPTILHSALPTFISSSTPLFLRANFNIDPIITPATYSICTFMSSVVELFIRLPIETVLRRGQVQVFTEQIDATGKLRKQSLDTIVDIGPYTGTIQTMWRISREEGETLQKTAASTRGAIGTAAHRPVYARRKGQGVQGLCRGWRVGMWGLVGVWGAAALGNAGGKGGEF